MDEAAKGEPWWLIEGRRVYAVQVTRAGCERDQRRVLEPGFLAGVYEVGVWLYESALVAHQRAREEAHRRIGAELEFIRDQDRQIETLIRKRAMERGREEARDEVQRQDV